VEYHSQNVKVLHTPTHLLYRKSS